MSVSLAGSIIDWGALLDVVWTSIVGGIGVTAVFSVAVLGATRGGEQRREGNAAAAAAYGLLLVLATAAVLAAVVFGVVVMTSKG
ncbi:MAG: hypothetical protein ACR2GL_05785 [Thermoleophilaceae bacterium]